MKNYFRNMVIPLVLGVFATSSSAETTSNETSMSEKYLQGSFRENIGQWRSEILYIGQLNQSQISFLDNGVSFTFRATTPVKSGDENLDARGDLYSTSYLVWNLDFLNTSGNKQILHRQKSDSRINYMIGNDLSKHVNNVPDYATVIYDNLYDNISLHYYKPSADEVKYDLIVQPGANISEVRFHADGTNGFDINRKGQLEVKTLWGILNEEKPYSYQIIGGKLKEVDVRFELYNEDTYGFKIVGNYDDRYELIIDPIVFDWHSYMGYGNGSFTNQYPFDIETDDDGYSYVTGLINEGVTQFITPGVYDDSFNGSILDSYVTKIHPGGTKVEFATFIGGNAGESGKGIDVDKDGNIYVTGWTSSSNFPTTSGAFQTKYGGNNLQHTKAINMWTNYFGGDIYVAKLNNDGTKLLYSTFVGGGLAEEPAGANGLRVNDNGEVFVTGYTMSGNFPTTNGAMQTTFSGGLTDGFVFRLSNDGSNLIYSTYYGGSGNDCFSTNGTLKLEDDSVYAKYKYPTDGHMQYHQRAGGIQINANNEAYVVGWTNSADFPTTPGVMGPTKKGDIDAFAFKLDANGKNLLKSTLIGGSARSTFGNQYNHSLAIGVDIDASDRVYITGLTHAQDFPVSAGAYDTDPSDMGYCDAFVMRMKADFTGVDYSTFIGGRRSEEFGINISVTPKNEVYVFGQTRGQGCTFEPPGCSDFPTTTCAIQSDNLENSEDLFILKADAKGMIYYSTVISGGAWDYQGNMDVNYNSSYMSCKEEVTVAYASHSLSVFQNSNTAHLPITENNYIAECNEEKCADILTVFKLKPDIGIDFSFGPAKCGSPVAFTSKAQGDCIWKPGPWQPTEWTWDFGNGKILKSNGHKGTDAVTSADNLGGLIGGTYANPTFQFDGAGSYDVILSVGCPMDTILKTVVIGSENGAVELGDDIKACGSINAILNANQPSGSVINWSTGENTNSINITKAGTYWVTVGEGQCQVSDTIEAILLEGLTPTATVVANPKCSGALGEATVNTNDGGVNGPYTYKWSDGQTTQTASNLAAGNYSVTVTNAAGCSGTTSVVINTSPSFDINTTLKDIDGCDRAGAVSASATVTPVGGTPPFTYQWDDPQNQTTATATGLPVGEYQVVVTDDAGCSAVDVVKIEEVIQISLHVDADPCGSCTDGRISATIGGRGTEPYTYRWDDDAQQTTLTATGLKPGVYTIIVTDDKGCRATATVSIGGVTTGAEEFDDFSLNIYPNPASGQLYVDPGNLRSPEFRMMDALGNLVSVATTRVGGQLKVDISDLSPAVYLVYVIDEKNIYTQRVIVISE